MMKFKFTKNNKKKFIISGLILLAVIGVGSIVYAKGKQVNNKAASSLENKATTKAADQPNPSNNKSQPAEAKAQQPTPQTNAKSLCIAKAKSRLASKKEAETRSEYKKLAELKKDKSKDKLLLSSESIQRMKKIQEIQKRYQEAVKNIKC